MAKAERNETTAFLPSDSFLYLVLIAVRVLFSQQAQPEPAGKASNDIVWELLPDKVRSNESFAQKGSSNRFKQGSLAELEEFEQAGCGKNCDGNFGRVGLVGPEKENNKAPKDLVKDRRYIIVQP